MSIQAQEKIGDNLAAGVVAVINADSPNFPYAAFGPRMTSSMPKSRCEVRSGGFTRASDQMAQNPNGVWYYAHRRGFLTATIVSQRHTLTKQGNQSTHSDAVGRFRYLMSIATRALQPNTVSNYQILDLIDQGEIYTQDTQTDTDRTDVRFQVDLWLAPNYYTAT